MTTILLCIHNSGLTALTSPIVPMMSVLSNLAGNMFFHLFAGFLGVITAFLPFYLGVGAVINEVFGRRILPV